MTKRRAWWAAGWLMGLVFFASQWYLYDAARHQAERFLYYVGSSAYLWGVLTPVVLWLGRRRPISSRTWKHALALHVVVSVGLTVAGLFLETVFWWLPRAGQWEFQAALRHCLTQHTQISLLTYWVLLSGVHVYAMYERTRKRELDAAQLEAKLADARLLALRAQLQPHFLFNTLQAATVLIYEDQQGAEEILLSLSELLRISLDAMQQQEVPLEQELEFVRHYAAIQQRRFGDRLRFEFEVGEGLGWCVVPSLVLQPLVENAIQHGIQKHKEADVITVRVFGRDEWLCLEVRNLTGVLNDVPERLFARGVGLANTRARFEQLYGSGQSFEIGSMERRGVVVRMSLPLRRAAEGERKLVEQAAG